MSDYLSALQDLFAPVFLAAFAVVALLASMARLWFGLKMHSSLAFLAAFAFLGSITGTIAGGSTEPIVGGLLSAMLALISAMLAYLFGRDTPDEVRQVLPFAMIALLVSALAGLSIGGIYVKRWISFEHQREQWKMDYQVYLEVKKYRQMREIDQELGVKSGG